MNPLGDTAAELRAVHEDAGGVTAIFSPRVADYDASRPDYPEALFVALRDRVPTGAAVADIGAGTGLLTRGLLAAGYQVLAVEPNTDMRQAADRRLGAHPRYRSCDGRAEAIPAATASLSLVCAAQAFHWFDIEPARAEFRRVLAPGGHVALIWNDRQRDAPLHQALDAIFAEFGGARRGALLAHEERQDLPRFLAGSSTEELAWPHHHRLDVDGLLALVFSRSYMPGRDTAAGRAARDEALRLFARLATAGEVVVPYRTVAFIACWD
jgi:SAM-dependent methyltransferase